MQRLLSGKQDQNFSFDDLRAIRSALQFKCHVKGDHFIYVRAGIEEIINIQPKGSQSKPYQVKQVRELVLKYQLGDM